ncbi:MAG: hypothetical protein AB7E09_07750 [Candidatus Izemoplasmatales bacterium]
MKKCVKFRLIFLSSIFIACLLGCNNSFNTTDIDYLSSTLMPTTSEASTTNENTTNDSLNLFYIEFIVDNEDGTSTRYRIANIELYPTFEEMKNSTTGEFRYLKLISVEEYSALANMYHFKDETTGNNISIVFYKNTYDFVINNKYMIHVFPDNVNDFYWISDSDRGIFRLENNVIICHPKFSDLYNLKVQNEDEFLNIFLRE